MQGACYTLRSTSVPQYVTAAAASQFPPHLKKPAAARLPAEPMAIGGRIQRSSRICLECSLAARVVTESLHATAPPLVRIQTDDTRSSPARPGRGCVPHWTALTGRVQEGDDRWDFANFSM